MKKCANHYAVAVDLGASGGKMAAASFDGSRIELADYITFPNQPVQILDTLYWDVFALYRSIVSGMTQYASELWPSRYHWDRHLGRFLRPFRQKKAVFGAGLSLPRQTHRHDHGCNL